MQRLDFDSQISYLRLFEMAEVRKDRGRIFLNMVINNYNVEMLLDSGAHLAVIDNRIWRAMGKPPLFETNASYISCTKTSIRLAGMLKVVARKLRSYW